MTTLLGRSVPAPFLGGPLKGKTTDRNTRSMTLAWERMTGFGYVPRVSPDGADSFEVTGKHGRPLSVWFGYPGSEHLMAVHCLLCGQDTYAYYSHMARGSSHDGCTVKGKVKRLAAMEEKTGAPVVVPPRQDQPNGATGKRTPTPSAEATEATEATETAAKIRVRRKAAAAAPVKLSKPQERSMRLIADNPGRVIAFQRGPVTREFLTINGNVEQALCAARLIAKKDAGTRQLAPSPRRGRSLGQGNRVRVHTWELTPAGKAALAALDGPQTAPQDAPAPKGDDVRFGPLRELLTFDGPNLF